MERREQKIDWITVLLFVVLSLFGWINIYAASVKDVSTPIFNLDHNAGRQFLWILIAAFLGLIILLQDAKFLEYAAFGFYGFGILLLLSVLLFGREVNGSKSWIYIGSIGFQPAEFAKVFTAMAVAKYMSGYQFSMKKTTNVLIAVGLIAAPAFLIILQKDTGSAIMFGSFIFMFYREGMRPLLIWGLFLASALAIASLLVFNKVSLLIAIAVLLFLSYYFGFKRRKPVQHVLVFFALSIFIFSVDFLVNNVLKEHQRARIFALLKPDYDPLGANWNTTQSKIAIGSGGLVGKGFMNGTQTKYDFVPEQSTDFIFCTVGEEWGWVGSVALLTLFGGLIWQTMHLAENAKSAYARIFGYSVAGFLFGHVTVNIAMTIGLGPVIGIPLPFISSGGSAMLAFTMMVFILLNLYSNRINILSSVR